MGRRSGKKYGMRPVCSLWPVCSLYLSGQYFVLYIKNAGHKGRSKPAWKNPCENISGHFDNPLKG